MNRIQPFRRLRLATLGLSLGAVLAVSSLPAAAPAQAAAGDTIRITPTATVAGGNGSTFTVKVVSNTATALSAIQASIVFDPAALQITTVVRSAAPSAWAAAPIFAPDPIGPAITAANDATVVGPLRGTLKQIGASYLSGTPVPTGTDQAFIDVTFRVAACPASGALTLGLPVGPSDAVLQSGVVSIDPITATGATVACTLPAANEFSVSASPASLTVPQGGSAQTTISATMTSGTGESVGLTSTPVAAVTQTFASTSLTPTASTTLTFAVGAGAAVGTFPVTVTGTAASATRTTIVTLIVTPPPAGPTPATGQVTVSGTVDAGFLGVSVQPNTALRLRRNAPNETSIPVLIFSNVQWTLSIEDAMLLGKVASDRGRMLDTGASPTKRLATAMQAYVPVATPALPIVRTLDLAGAQSLASGALGATVPVTISQLIQPADAPGNYAIDLVFSAISGF